MNHYIYNCYEASVSIGNRVFRRVIGANKERMAYNDREKDMSIIHNEAIIEFGNRIERKWRR